MRYQIFDCMNIKQVTYFLCKQIGIMYDDKITKLSLSPLFLDTIFFV